MKELSPKERQIVKDWKERLEKYEEAKKVLKSELAKHGLASREFGTARVDFEMIKEEFDNFEKENYEIIKEYKY